MKFALLASITFLLIFPVQTFCQRDYFTPEEIELIRDAQRIDLRIAVLTHAVDRRFAALNLDVKAPAYKEIKGVDWGAPPTGSRFELFVDVKRILEKAVDDIDNLSERPSSMPIEDQPDKKHKKPPPGFAELFPAAVRSLAAAADRYEPVLKAEAERSKAEDERGAILDSIEICEEIRTAVTKLPAAADPATPKH